MTLATQRCSEEKGVLTIPIDDDDANEQLRDEGKDKVVGRFFGEGVKIKNEP